jgi:hypothetical protein
LAAIEKWHAKRMLEVGHDFRHGGLRDSELRRGLRHAPALHGSEKHVQVAQLEAVTDLTFPIDFSRHRKFL